MPEKESGNVRFSYHREDGADERPRYLHIVR